MGFKVKSLAHLQPKVETPSGGYLAGDASNFAGYDFDPESGSSFRGGEKRGSNAFTASNEQLFGQENVNPTFKVQGLDDPMYKAVANRQSQLHSQNIGNMKNNAKLDQIQRTTDQIKALSGYASAREGSILASDMRFQQERAQKGAARSAVLGSILGIAGAGAGALLAPAGAGLAGAGVGMQLGAGIGGMIP